MKTREEINARIWELLEIQRELLDEKGEFNTKRFDNITGRINALQWVLL